MCYVMERAPPVNVARPQVTRSSDFRVVGREVEASDQKDAPLPGTEHERKQQNDIFGQRFPKENRHGNKAQTEERYEMSASGRERDHTVPELSSGEDNCTEEEGSGQLDILTRPVWTTFTSFLSFRFASPRSGQPAAAESRPKPSIEPRSSPVVLKIKPGNKQVNGRTSEPPAQNSLPTTVKLSFPAKKEEQAISCSIKSSLSRGLCNEVGALESPDGFQSVKSTEDAPMNLAQSYEVDIADPTAIMLSSTMVSVLAPHRSARPRRTKRCVETEDLDDHGNLQNVTYGSNRLSFETLSRHSGDRGMRQGPHAQDRASLMGTKRSTVGWSTMSGPPSINVESATRGPVSQSVSLAVHSKILDNRGKESCVSNTMPRTEPPVSSLSFTRHEPQGISQAAHQGKLSSSKSKPVTSSLLLSLRKHCSWRNSALSGANPGSTSDRGAEVSTRDPLSTSPNNNEQDQWNSLCSPTSSSTINTNLICSPPSPNNGEGGISNIALFSASSINRDPERQRNLTQSETSPTPLCPRKQMFLTDAPSEKQQTSLNAEEIITGSPLFSSRLSQFDRYAFLKSQTLPRGTTLSATSWWKQDTQEDNSFSDETNINKNENETSAPAFAPCNKNTDCTFASTNDNKRFSYQIPASEDNNTTAQFLHKSNPNIAFKTKGGASVLIQNKAQDTPGQSSGRFPKQPDGSSLNGRAAQRPQSLPSFSFKTRISNTTGQTMLTHPQGLSKVEVNNNITELPLTLPKPKSQNIPTESISNQMNHHYIPSTASHTGVSCESSSSSNSHPLSLKVHNPATTKLQLLGFERTYPPIHKSVHPKLVSSLISTTSMRLSSSPRTSLLTSPTSHPTTAVTTSFLLTPPATPTRPPSPKTSHPGGERTFSGSLDLTPKKDGLHLGAREARRVKWQDSVDLQPREASDIQALDSPRSHTSPPSYSRPTQSVETPSIYSLLRVSNPSESTSPCCPPTPKTTSIQSWRGGKSEKPSLLQSSNQGSTEEGNTQTSASDRRLHFTFDHRERALTSPGTLSEEAKQGHCRSLSSDFASGYNFRYSFPPYFMLKSTQSTEGHGKNAAAVSPLFPEISSAKSPTDLQPPLHSDPAANIISHAAELPQSCIDSRQPLSNRTGLADILTFDSTEKDCVKDDSRRQGRQSSKDIISQPLPLHADRVANFPSTCVVETLVYRISKVDSTVNVDSVTPLINHGSNKSNSVGASNLHCQSHQNSNERRSDEGNDECSNRKTKRSAVGKSRSFPLQSKKEILPSESPNKVLSSTRKNVSSPNETHKTSFLPDKARPETGRTQKSTKMDQVFSRLRQAFSSRYCEDDFVKYKQASPTSSVNGSSNIKAMTNKTVERRERLTGEAVRIGDTEVEKREGWTENRYTLITSSDKENNTADSRFPNWSGKTSIDSHQSMPSALEALQKDENALTKEQLSESKIVAGLRSHSPVGHPFDVYKDSRVDYKPTNQSLYRDPSNARQQCGSFIYSATFPMKRRSSTASSYSPLCPYTPGDGADDSVFCSPKSQHQNESPSFWEPGGVEGSPESTGPTIGEGPRRDNGHMRSHSSCADLKYGIEARRSISVSSVLSSRPSGPGRISKSVSPPAALLSFDGHSSRGTGRGLDQWSVTGHQTSSKNRCQSVGDSWGDKRASFARNDPGQMKSRSLPRSLASSLFSWGADFTAPPNQITTNRYTSTKPGLARSPTSPADSHVAWDTEGPLTPPPSPPRSPVSSCISKPPSLSSPPSPRSPGSSQDSQSSPRGHLPSRGYFSSLSAFKESSDSSSETTTDDEYYLEAEEGEEMETEL